MPNQNFRGHDDMNLVECDLTKSYKSCRPSEKVCRFAYASWCPVCDLDSHRRRTKSESTEVVNLRKRGRDNMKTPSPRKCDRSKESYTENKDFLDLRDPRLESSRVRTNLCELPTSYITSNCQTNVPSSIHDKSQATKFCNGSSDFVDPLYNDHHLLKHYSSEIASEFSAIINGPALHKSDPSKCINVKNGDNKLNGVHRYFSLTNKIENTVDSELKQNGFVKSPYKGAGMQVSSASKAIRDIPIPHKEKMISLSPKHKTTNDISPPQNDILVNKKHPLSAGRVTDREKLLSKNNCCINCETNNLLPKKNNIPLRRTPVKENTKVKESPKKQINSHIPPEGSHPRDTENSKIKILSKESHVSTNPKILNIESSAPEENVTNNADLIDLKRHRVRQLSDSDNSNDIHQEKTVDITKAVTKKAREVSPLENRKDFRAKSAVKLASIKARQKLSAVKLRKVRNKIAHSVSSDSDFSNSDASETEDEEDTEETDSEILAIPVTVSTGATPVSVFTPAVSTVPDEGKWPIRPSLFAFVPPYISFASHKSETFHLPVGSGRFFKWRLSTITPVVVRKTLQNTGFRLVKSESERESNDWIGCWGKHMKSVCFQSLKETQKLNHFPGTFQIGRKDRLWKNLQRLMFKFGQKEFGFIPRTFVLPHDLKLLRNAWEKTGQEKWIIKPPASARGTGIKVIHRWAHLPKKRSLVVQQYISNPYLINGSKFDLRLYVLVTSFNPLRIYLYPDGLARFASTKYSDDVNSLSDRYMHLTNYSINKLSSQYTANEDANACKGHKWTISKLWEYMEKQGVNTKNLWRSLQQLVIKTILCGESSITQLYKANISSRYNCYELFGIDVLLDERLKPWLLEVNISPSLHSASPLDLHVKGPLVQTLLNLAQFHLPTKLSRMRRAPQTLNIDLYTTQLTTKERLKHINFLEYELREEYLGEILNDLTGDDVRHLIQAEDELTVIGNFERVFPTRHTHHYMQFMEVRYYNRLFDAWETKYEKNRSAGIKLLQTLCEQRVHLVVVPAPVSKSLQSETDQESNTEQSISEDLSIPAPSFKRSQMSPDSCNTEAAYLPSPVDKKLNVNVCTRNKLV